MKQILNNDDLIVGEHYWCRLRSQGAQLWTIQRVGQISDRKFIGEHHWATSDNSQALEKFTIVGPIERPSGEF